MIKHVGTHDQKKVVIIYRKVPNQDHMCLLVYSDSLPRAIHDTLMQTLESSVGQQSKDLADPLYRSYLPDGRITLQALHKDGLLKRVATSQVIMTPTNKDKIRLDELNVLLDKIEQGGEAVKILEEKNASLGMGTGVKQGMTESKTTSASINPDAPQAPILHSSAGAALSDEDIANDLLRQSAKMKGDAASLLAESARLEAEAQKLNPELAKKEKPAKSKVVKAEKKTQVKATKRK